MSEIHIREAMPADAAAILDYLNKIGGESINLLFTENAFVNTTIPEEAAIIKKMVAGTNSTMILALDGQQVVSVSSLNGSDRPRAAHRTTLAISVSRTHWNRGIGSKVLNRLIDIAKSKELEIIDLEVKADNQAAIRLYQKAGFKEIGRYPHFLKIDAHYYDGIFMVLHLN
ncbi:GNAT family protein [uncultured Vagococcus sp.]|uniref:GNAT family N-acetyltransferase n=1 Tax=uncultured Vagococcus sp. TaxID=189676 RepID=UPI0028D5FEF6|nr:GNAT family protein [uncultured Vagococcus sp.]